MNAIKWHREMAAHLRERAKTTVRDWTGHEISEDDRRANYADARKDRECAQWHEDAANTLEAKLKVGE